MSNAPIITRANSAPYFGGVDAGGTKFLCVIGSSPAHIEKVISIRTESPQQTRGKVADYSNEWLAAGKSLTGIGISSFGPLTRDPQEAGYGRLRNSPKPGWETADIGSFIRQRVAVPLAIDTDVNGAALAEARWGAAAALEIRHYAYVTVGTGIGVGTLADRVLINGLAHPELGLYGPPRMRGDRRYKGCCPFHGACLERLIADRPSRKERGREDTDWPKIIPYGS